MRHICKLLERKFCFNEAELVKALDASTQLDCDSGNPHPTIQTEPLARNVNVDNGSLPVNAQSTGGKEDKSFDSGMNSF